MRNLLCLIVVSVSALSEELSGIGVSIVDRKTPQEPVRINRVFPGSGAAKAGLKGEFFLLSVGGTNVVGMPINEIAAALRGVAGSEVIIGVSDLGRMRTNEYRVKRAVIRPVDFE